MVAGLAVFLAFSSNLPFIKTKWVTTGYIAFWLILAVIGAFGRRSAIMPQKTVFVSFLGFFYFYYFNWATWPKGTYLDELMWAYSAAHALAPFLLGSFFERRDLRIFLVATAWWASILGGWVVVSYVAAQNSPLYYETARFTVAWALNPISQSRVIGFAVLVLYARALMNPRFYHYPLILVLLFSMLLGGSRGSVIALMVAFALMTFLAGKLSRRGGAIVVFGGLLAVAFLYLPVPSFERYFSSDRWLETQTGEGIPSRVDRVLDAIEHWEKHPLFGSGTSGNIDIFYSHTLVVQILMELGVFGLLLFCGILIPLLLNFFRNTRWGREDAWEICAFGGMLFYGLIAAQMTGTFMTLNFLWLPMGILTAWPRIIGTAEPELIRIPGPHSQGQASGTSGI